MKKRIQTVLMNENGASTIEAMILGGFILFFLPLIFVGIYFLLNMDAGAETKLETITETRIEKNVEIDAKEQIKRNGTGE